MAAAQSANRIFVQAESMTLVAPMAAGNDNAAMGGRFISAPSGTSTTSPVRSAHVQVNVPAGTYYLWARIAGPTMESDALYVGIDASFARVFPSTPGPYEWVRVATANGSAVYGFSLGAGNHTIQVGYGEIGAKLDAVYLTDDANDVPSFGPQRLLIEAESLHRMAPMTVGTDAAAMGGQYLSPTSGSSSTSPVRSADGQVSLPIAGTYYLWARIAGPTMTSDALYVGIDVSFDRVFPSAQGPYQWVRVETADGSGAYGFSLAGDHIIQVGYGEIGARLDAVYLTDDALEVPSFGPLRLTIEAETMTLTPPMTVGSDTAASGGQYVSPTSGSNSSSPVREAWTTLNVPSAGTYYLWARLWGPSMSSDALYVGINASFDRVFPSASAQYQWVRVETADGSAVHGFALGAGQHTIQVGHGEIGARLDALYVTDNASDSPGGATPPPPPPPPSTDACALPTGAYQYQGFGRNTTGGAAFASTPTRVTNLNDSGAGSLRDALSQGNRCVVFDGLTAGGTITVSSPLNVRSNVTIDGFTAPSPGITLVNNASASDPNQAPPLVNVSGVNNVVVRGIRIRNAPGDAIRVVNGTFNVVIDRVSITRFGDGAIDVTQNARDVTIQWSILGNGRPNHNLITLLALGGMRVSVHHNLYIDGQDRQPKCGGTSNSTSPPDVVCDARNNVIWDYTQRGTFVGDFGTGNVVNNYYHTSTASPAGAIDLDRGGRAFVSGNHRHNVGPFGVSGSEPQPYPAVVPTTITDAVTAARDVKAGAGARGPRFVLDATDQAFINRLSIP